MKRLFSMVILFLSLLIVQAQRNVKPLDVPIKMDVNVKYFPKNNGNVFISEDPLALITSYVYLKPFAELKNEFSKPEIEKRGMLVYYDLDGKTNKGYNYYSIKGIVVDNEIEMMTIVYLIQLTSNYTMIVIGTYDNKESAAYADAIDNAAKSATIE